jgi:hypothetical protein
MKKLLILAAAIVAAVAANAASFNWGAANIYGPDGTTKYSGDVTLYCTQVDGWSVSATATAGAINKNNTTFSSDKFVAGTSYDFYFVIEDAGKAFTSSAVSKGAQQSDTATIQFGNMAAATQNTSNWQSVPEPTSGLLLLLGVAGLALRRKRA